MKIWKKYWAVLITTFKFFPWANISLEQPYREFCHSTSLNTKNSSQIYRNWDFIIPAEWVFVGVAETKVATVLLCFLLLACEWSADTPIFLISIIFPQSLQCAVVVTGWDCNQSLNLDSVSQAAWKWHSFDILAIFILSLQQNGSFIWITSEKENRFYVCVNHTSQTALVRKSWPNKFRNYNSA